MDRPNRSDGTFILADAAADAEIFIDIGLVHFSPIDDFDSYLDRFIRDRAMLLADDTLFTIRPGNAKILVDICQTEPGPLLFFKRQTWYGSGRTGITAERALIFTIADLGKEVRCPDASEAAL